MKSEKNQQQNEDKEKIHWHKFPDDQKHGDVWRNKIPHQKWDVTEHTRICHKHFLPTDYESERNDKQSRRKSKKGDFVLWILKSAAVSTECLARSPITPHIASPESGMKHTGKCRSQRT